jgi:hypothetical protein
MIQVGPALRNSQGKLVGGLHCSSALCGDMFRLVDVLYVNNPYSPMRQSAAGSSLHGCLQALGRCSFRRTSAGAHQRQELLEGHIPKVLQRRLVHPLHAEADVCGAGRCAAGLRVRAAYGLVACCSQHRQASVEYCDAVYAMRQRAQEQRAPCCVLLFCAGSTTTT